MYQLHSYNYYPFGSPMPERSFSSPSYRYGFQGQEKDDEIKGEGNSYSAQFWQYDSRLGRRWNVDPVVKTHESPYAAFANNPLMFVDPNGADTLVVHTQFLKNVGDTRVIKLTFSLIKNGVSKIIEPNIPEGGDGMYWVMPKEYWIGGNKWSTEGSVDMFQIKFEPYNSYKNTIRVHYPDKSAPWVRVMSHKGNYSDWSVGCQVPTCSIDNIVSDEWDGETYDKIKTEKSQEVLDEVRRLYDLYIPSSLQTDKWGRKVTTPNEGFDFMIKTNSIAVEYLEMPLPEKRSATKEHFLMTD